MISCTQELQRRLDQTLGKPGSYLTGIDRVGNAKPMTVGARLYRVEQQLSIMDRKLDQLIYSVNVFTTNQNLKMLPSSVSQMHIHPNQQHHSQAMQSIGYQQTASAITAQQLQLPPQPSQSPSPVTTLTHLEDDV